MRAVVVRQFGVLKVEEIPTPQPKGDEVLVEIKAASINPSDVKNVAGKMHGTTLPRVPGRDFAGVVVRGQSSLIGKEVWGTGGDIGFTRDGSHAQYILLPASAVAQKPASLSMEAAGAAGVTFVTAWSALVTAAKITSGETVAIIGAAGGVGSAAVQIAKAHSAHVIGFVRSEKDKDVARRNGADEVLDNPSAISDRADVVFDTTGMMLAQSIDIAAKSGRIPVITAPPDGKATVNLRDLYHKMLRIIGVDSRPLDASACAKLLEEMFPYFESGQFKSSPGKPMPLSDAVEAYKLAAAGGGHIVLQPTGG